MSEGAQDSVLRGDVVAVARTGPLIAFACMLLAEQLVFHPEVAAHLQVEAAVCARVALRVAETLVHDPHRLGAGTQPNYTSHVTFVFLIHQL